MTPEEKIIQLADCVNEWAGLAVKKTAEIAAATEGASSGTSSFTMSEDSPEMVQFRADRARFEEKLAAFERRELDNLLAKLTQAGIAVPVVETFKQLREHMLPGKIAASVVFKSAAGGSDISLAEYLDRFMSDIADRVAANTFAAPLKPSSKPFHPETPAIHGDNTQSNVLNFEADKIIKAYSEEHNIAYGDAMTILQQAGKIHLA